MSGTDASRLTPEFLAQTRTPQILFGCIFTTVIASIAVLGRFYSRAIILKVWGLDDTLILISWLGGGIVVLAINIVLCDYGSGRHIETLNLGAAEHSQKLGFVAKELYQFSITVTKLAICAFYARIFTDRTSKIVIYAVAAVTLLSGLSLMIAHLTRCSPGSGAWDLHVVAKCHYEPPIVISSTILNIIEDLALLLFVMPKIAKLQIASKQKYGLMAVLAVSILVVVAAIVRCVRVVHELDFDFDISWVTYDVTIWTAVEINTGLFCASVPCIKPLLQKMVPGMLSSNAKSSNPSKGWTGPSSNAYATGTRRRTNHDIELSSQTDLNASAGRELGVWSGTRQYNVKHSTANSDDSSEDVELGNQSTLKPDAGIMKTVQVSVSEGSFYFDGGKESSKAKR